MKNHVRRMSSTVCNTAVKRKELFFVESSPNRFFQWLFFFSSVHIQFFSGHTFFIEVDLKNIIRLCRAEKWSFLLFAYMIKFSISHNKCVQCDFSFQFIVNFQNKLYVVFIESTILILKLTIFVLEWFRQRSNEPVLLANKKKALKSALFLWKREMNLTEMKFI